jgi:hypothetical protein
MRRTKAIDRLAAVGPAVLDAWSKPGIGRCILSTAVGLDVLAALGFEAEPWPVEVEIANAAYARLVPHVDLFAARVAGAWAVTVGRSTPAGGPGWNGHLVIRPTGADLIVDLDAGQFSRPAHGIAVPPALIVPWLREMAGVEGVQPGGVRVRYTRDAANTGYREAPDWRLVERRRPIVAEIVRLIRKGAH